MLVPKLDSRRPKLGTNTVKLDMASATPDKKNDLSEGHLDPTIGWIFVLGGAMSDTLTKARRFNEQYRAFEQRVGANQANEPQTSSVSRLISEEQVGVSVSLGVEQWLFTAKLTAWSTL